MVLSDRLDHKWKSERWRSPILLVSVGAVLGIIIVISGELDALVQRGRIIRTFAGVTIVLYWIYFALAISAFRTWKRDRRKFLTGATVITSVLFAVEILVRAFHPGHALPEFCLTYSPRYHHVAPPNQVMYHSNGDGSGGPVLVRTNGDGFRTAYSRQQFRAHNVRIIAIGDSFTFGFWIKQNAALPQTIEQVLRSRTRRNDIAVLNAGGIGWSPFLYRLMFDDILQDYDPTLVLLFLDVTDFGDDFAYSQVADTTDGTIIFPRTGLSVVMDAFPGFLRHSALVQRSYWPLALLCSLTFRPVMMARSDLNPLTIPDLEIDGNIERNRFFIYRYPFEKTREFFDFTFSCIEKVSERTASLGATFVLVVLPRFHHWSHRECPGYWGGKRLLGFYEVDEPYQYELFRYIESKSQEVDFPILSLLPAFQSATEFPLVFEDDPHWNEDGHRVATLAVVDYLLNCQLMR